jgi:hypothetical protein
MPGWKPRRRLSAEDFWVWIGLGSGTAIENTISCNSVQHNPTVRIMREAAGGRGVLVIGCGQRLTGGGMAF